MGPVTERSCRDRMSRNVKQRTPNGNVKRFPGTWPRGEGAVRVLLM